MLLHSLPISETLIPPVQRRKAEELDDNKPSQYQIKKEKRAAKKNKKQKNNRNVNIQNIAAFPQHNSGNNSENESDADVEDNVEVRKKFNIYNFFFYLFQKVFVICNVFYLYQKDFFLSL